MTELASPRLLLNQEFSDVDEFSSGIEWDCDFRQLSAGPVKAHASVLGTSNIVVMRCDVSQSLLQAGQAPSNMLTFGLADPEVGDFRWCRTGARGGDLLNFSLANGFEGVSKESFGGFAISIREDFLQEASELLGLTLDQCLDTSSIEVWRDVDRVTYRLRQLFSGAFDTATMASSSETNESFDSSVASILLEEFSNGYHGVPRVPLSFRKIALHATINFLEQTEELPLTVMELCQKVRFSAPTLYRAFMEEFGIGPKRYLQIMRLTGARRDLVARRRTESIADIANRWDFWHLGKFAADYKLQFGELPSETRVNH